MRTLQGMGTLQKVGALQEDLGIPQEDGGDVGGQWEHCRNTGTPEEVLKGIGVLQEDRGIEGNGATAGG